MALPLLPLPPLPRPPPHTGARPPPPAPRHGGPPRTPPGPHPSTSPARRNRSASENLRAAANRSPNARSAVASVRTSGVLHTRILLRVASATSMLLTPTAKLETTRSVFPAVSMRGASIRSARPAAAHSPSRVVRPRNVDPLYRASRWAGTSCRQPGTRGDAGGSARRPVERGAIYGEGDREAAGRG